MCEVKYGEEPVMGERFGRWFEYVFAAWFVGFVAVGMVISVGWVVYGFVLWLRWLNG